MEARVKKTMSSDIHQNLKILRSVVKGHLKLIDLIQGILTSDPDYLTTRKENIPIEEEIITVLVPTLLVLKSSCKTILDLSRTPGIQVRDCFCIARSIVELAVNICYILAGGPSVAEKTLRHARQKMYRNIQRESKIGKHSVEFSFSGEKNLRLNKNLEIALKEFTSSKGREKDWTDLNIDQRIDKVGEAFGENVLGHLHLTRFMIYRDASEILHGTVFGALYSLGLVEPTYRSALENPANEYGGKHLMVLMGSISAVMAVEKSFHKKYGFEYLDKRSRKLWEKIGTSPWSKETNNEQINQFKVVIKNKQ